MMFVNVKIDNSRFPNEEIISITDKWRKVA